MPGADPSPARVCCGGWGWGRWGCRRHEGKILPLCLKVFSWARGLNGQGDKLICLFTISFTGHRSLFRNQRPKAAKPRCVYTGRAQRGGSGKRWASQGAAGRSFSAGVFVGLSQLHLPVLDERKRLPPGRRRPRPRAVCSPFRKKKGSVLHLLLRLF